jgi:hypothetical protein
VPRSRYCILVLIAFLVPRAFGQPGPSGSYGPYSIEVFGAYTTSSKLFPYAADPSDIRRAFFLPLTDIFHVGTEIRASISALDLEIGLGTEYIQKTEVVNVEASPSAIPVTDGYRVIPVELSGYFRLPIGNDRIRVTLGGGVGLYAGERIYRYYDLAAPATGRTGGFGIHIVAGGEYSLFGRWALRGEFKARDIQFESVNQFLQPSLIYQGNVVTLPQQPFTSKFSIDGLSFRMGIALSF